MQKYKRLFTEISTYDAVEGIYQLMNSSEGMEWLAEYLEVDIDKTEIDVALKNCVDSEIRYMYQRAKESGLTDKVHNEFKNYVSMKGN